jgi:membrane protease YdiL (CAAX protease family)
MPANDPHPSSKVQLIELGVFLLLIIPSMVLSFFSFQRGANPPFTVFALASMLQQSALLCLVLYFVWRNQEPFSRFGWSAKNLNTEALIGVGLYFPIAFGVGGLQVVLKKLGLQTLEGIPGYLSPANTGEYGVAVALFTVVAVAEEGVFRGYLIRRLENLTGQAALAVAAAALIFCIGHGYQSLGGVVATFILGGVFGVIYLWRSSLVAPIVIHFLQNTVTVFITGR